jgi:S1-C subfamily serine protease
MTEPGTNHTNSDHTPTHHTPADHTPAAPTAEHRPRWRSRDIVAMGLAAALVVGSAGGGVFWAATAVAGSQVASAQTSSRTETTAPETTAPESTAPESTAPGTSTDPGTGTGTEASGGYPGQGSTPGSGSQSTATLDTSAATAAQSVGVVVIDTVLPYENASAAGTGIVLTADGQVLTNNHVVAGATSITVTVVSTGAEYTAEVVGTDASADIAVLDLVDASNLATVDLDTSASVAVADAVTGVGNAGGTGDLTAAAGTVANLEQSITAQNSDGSDAEELTGLIEVDADIQSGESGGPLFDVDGEVIGINTAASSGTAEIVGYAIPIEDALDVAAAIDAAAATGVDTDTISVGYPAFLGIGLGSTTASSSSTAAGTAAASVAGVIAGTPAEQIGLAAGDTITAVDGVATATATALSDTLAGYEPGDTVTLDWVDAVGVASSAAVTLIAGPVA